MYVSGICGVSNGRSVAKRNTGRRSVREGKEKMTVIMRYNWTWMSARNRSFSIQSWKLCGGTILWQSRLLNVDVTLHWFPNCKEISNSTDEDLRVIEDFLCCRLSNSRQKVIASFYLEHQHNSLSLCISPCAARHHLFITIYLFNDVSLFISFLNIESLFFPSRIWTSLRYWRKVPRKKFSHGPRVYRQFKRMERKSCFSAGPLKTWPC